MDLIKLSSLCHLHEVLMVILTLRYTCNVYSRLNNQKNKHNLMLMLCEGWNNNNNNNNIGNSLYTPQSQTLTVTQIYGLCDA